MSTKTVTLPAPSDREQEAITEASTRRIARRPCFAARMVDKGTHRTEIDSPHADKPGWCERVADAFGSPSPGFIMTELDRLSTALKVDGAAREGVLNAALAMLDGQRPKNEIEAALIIQMAVTHAYAMDLMSRSKRAEFFDHMEATGKLAIRLLRTYAVQVDTLMSLRRGGKQLVEVRHAHAYRPRQKREEGPEKWQPRGPNGRFTAPASRELEEVA
jgi:hypothetical protein